MNAITTIRLGTANVIISRVSLHQRLRAPFSVSIAIGHAFQIGAILNERACSCDTFTIIIGVHVPRCQGIFCCSLKFFSACVNKSSLSDRNFGESGLARKALNVLIEYAAGPSPTLNTASAAAWLKPLAVTSSRKRSLVDLSGFMYPIVGGTILRRQTAVRNHC